MKCSSCNFGLLAVLFALPLFLSHTVKAELIFGVPALLLLWWVDALVITLLVGLWSYKKDE